MSEQQANYMTTATVNPIIAKCQAGQNLTWQEYCEGANRTLSDNFYGDEFDYDVALALLDEFIWVGQYLDKLKKALFYGKDLQESYKSTRANFYDTVPTEEVGHDWPSNVEPVAIHSILGIATEAVELVENLRKALVGNTEMDWVNLVEEFGDVIWYMHIPFIYGAIDPDINPVLRKNLLKLYARFKDKFDTEKAINRDLDTERRILETAI